MDVLTEEMMLDILNVAKVVFKKGVTGVIILGDKLQKVFTALPEHFTASDYDVHITTSTDIIKDSE
jgi:deoxyhypusine synthase